ncbi:hypothetical protein PM082_019957 [Marasmius tenuissimus]|nr:hypothetical protein PM082_019957 [Marasmius tenuissimus]
MLTSENDKFIQLFQGSVNPLRVCLVGFTWGLHDYLITLQDEASMRSSLSVV